MKLTTLFKRSVFISLFVGLFSLSAVAMPCGTVPVFCIIKNDHTYNDGENNKHPYYIASKEVACVATEFKLGYAAPICRANVDEAAHFEKCKTAYPARNGQRVIGIAYYKGGDPVNPANKEDMRMHGTVYNVVKIFDKSAPKLSPLMQNHFKHGCDIVA